MTLNFLPWALLAVLISAAGGLFYGVRLGEDRQIAKQATEDSKLAKVAETAQNAAAAEIAKIKIVNRTNETRLEREIVRVPDFSNCRAGADGKRVLDDALAGKTGAESPGGGGVPGTDPAL